MPRSTQASSQITGVFERKKVEVRFIGRMETCDPSNFLVEVVVSDLSKASLINCRQLNQINWGPWCACFVGVRTSRLVQSMIFLKLDHEVLGWNRGTRVPLVPESSGTSKASKLALLNEQVSLIREKGCSVFE